MKKKKGNTTKPNYFNAEILAKWLLRDSVVVKPLGMVTVSPKNED